MRENLSFPPGETVRGAVATLKRKHLSGVDDAETESVRWIQRAKKF
jgi:hypothetical protein